MTSLPCPFDYSQNNTDKTAMHAWTAETTSFGFVAEEEGEQESAVKHHDMCCQAS